MKKNILLIGCLVLGLTSCYKSVLDPLSGTFPAPTTMDVSGTISASSEKVDGKRLFNLDLNDGGNSAHLCLVGDKYFLTANTYTEASEDAAKKGNFILGKTTVNGSRVKNGKVVVAHTPLSETSNYYTISAILFTEDGSPYKLSWKGNLDFYPDPVVGDIVVENVFVCEDTPTEAGTIKHSLTISGATEAFFELFTPAGVTGIAGTYTCIEYAENNAEGYVVSNGWSFPDWGIAGGSHYFVDGVQVDVQPGTVVTVSQLSQTAYAISVNGVVIVAGENEGEAIVIPNTLTVETSATEAGTNKYAVTILDEDGAQAAFLELYTPGNAAGMDGTFTCIEYAENNADGYVVSNGWSFPDWGIAGGSHYMAGGAQVDIQPGEVVSVALIGPGMYAFSVSSGFSMLAKMQ